MARPVRYSFWANDLADERTVWEGCLGVLSKIDNPRLIHYGSYETQFLKRMRTRYPDVGAPVFSRSPYFVRSESAVGDLRTRVFSHLFQRSQRGSQLSRVPLV